MSAKQIVNRLLEDYDPDLAEVSPEDVAYKSGQAPMDIEQAYECRDYKPIIKLLHRNDPPIEIVIDAGFGSRGLLSRFATAEFVSPYVVDDYVSPENEDGEDDEDSTRLFWYGWKAQLIENDDGVWGLQLSAFTCYDDEEMYTSMKLREVEARELPEGAKASIISDFNEFSNSFQMLINEYSHTLAQEPTEEDE